MKTSALPLPRFVSLASVDVGDTVRATWTINDVEHSRIGTIGRVLYEVGMKTLITPGGETICQAKVTSSAVRVTLLKEAQRDNGPTLFDMEPTA